MLLIFGHILTHMNTTKQVLPEFVRMIVWHNVNSTAHLGEIKVERAGSAVDKMSDADAAKWFANELRLHRMYASAKLLRVKFNADSVKRVQTAYRLMVARTLRNARNHRDIPMTANGIDARVTVAEVVTEPVTQNTPNGWRMVLKPLPAPRRRN